MFKPRIRLVAGFAVLGVFIPAFVWSQQDIPLSVRAQPKATPVADTKLLMEGIAQANFKGVEKMLKGKPEDVEAWTFARGQSLLMAETGNLLLMRPPNQGREVWNKCAVELRESATRLGRAAAERDLNTSRARLTEVANACNKCHQSFRVAARLNPFHDEK
jgi:cytochrome c556